MKKRRKRNQNVGGRPILPTICPTCARVDGFVQTERHVPYCANNATPNGRAMTVAAWKADIFGTEYECPVGCGEWHTYSEMHRHIPSCAKQNKIFPYTVDRWRLELIKKGIWPGAQNAAKRYQELTGREIIYPPHPTDAAVDAA